MEESLADTDDLEHKELRRTVAAASLVLADVRHRALELTSGAILLDLKQGLAVEKIDEEGEKRESNDKGNC